LFCGFGVKRHYLNKRNEKYAIQYKCLKNLGSQSQMEYETSTLAQSIYELSQTSETNAGVTNEWVT